MTIKRAKNIYQYLYKLSNVQASLYMGLFEKNANIQNTRNIFRECQNILEIFTQSENFLFDFKVDLAGHIPGNYFKKKILSPTYTICSNFLKDHLFR